MIELFDISFLRIGQLTDNDISSVLRALQDDIPPANIKALCEKYLDPGEFHNSVRLVSGVSYDALELYSDKQSITIQEAINRHPDPETIYMEQPALSTLPIVMIRVSNDCPAYMIPSAKLEIDRILSRAPLYRLQAVVCEVNERAIVFFKNLANDKWYFYQSYFTCEPLNTNINHTLNVIIESRSRIEQENLIRSAHFLLSLIFFNATKYIYIIS